MIFNIFTFIKYQLSQIIKNPKLLNKKLFILFKYGISIIFLILLSPLIISIIIIIRLLRPLIIIRFGRIRSDVIGHFVFDTSYYLKNNIKSKKKYDIFFISTFPVANKYYLKLIKRQMLIFQPIIILYYIEKLINNNSDHLVQNENYQAGDRDIKGVFYNSELIHKFTYEEDKLGYKFLEKFNISKEDKFVCLIIRDSGYKNFQNSSIDWSYHNYRDSKIHTYLTSIKFLLQKNYKVIRMGKIVNEKFLINNENFIDYPFLNEKSDFLDIWLIAKSFFCLTTDSGLSQVGIVFNKPMLFVNHLPYGDCRTGSPKIIELFKKLYYKKSSKFLSLRDQIKMNLIHTLNGNDYLNNNIEIIDNSEEEILNAVKEIEELVSNKNNSEQSYDEIQKIFWKIFNEWEDFNKYHGKIKPKISSKFLKENYKWLFN